MPISLSVLQTRFLREEMGISGQFISNEIFPPTLVSGYNGTYPVYTSSANIVDDSIDADTGQARTITNQQTEVRYNLTGYSLRETISKARLDANPALQMQEMKIARDSLQMQMLANKEVRTINAITVISASQKIALSGNGAGETNMWTGTGGDPIKAIKSARKKMTYPPNIMILTQDILEVLEVHTKILDALPITDLKIAKIEHLKSLFKVENIIISNARGIVGAISKSNVGQAPLLWGTNVVLAYVNKANIGSSVGAVFYMPNGGSEFGIYTGHDDNAGTRGSHIMKMSTDQGVHIFDEKKIALISNTITVS